MIWPTIADAQNTVELKNIDRKGGLSPSAAAERKCCVHAHHCVLLTHACLIRSKTDSCPLDVCVCCLYLLPAETDNSQRVVDNESSQPLKLRERQRFFEEVFQHDGDIYLASSHLHVDCRKRK